jgi:hypothetical protein
MMGPHRTPLAAVTKLLKASIYNSLPIEINEIK